MLMIFLEDSIPQRYFSVALVFIAFAPVLLEIIPWLFTGGKAMFAWTFMLLFSSSLLLFILNLDPWAFLPGIGALIVYGKRLKTSSPNFTSGWVVGSILLAAFLIGYFLNY